MAALLDTSVVLRYLTQLPADQAAIADALMDSEERFVLTDVAILEASHVLTHRYGHPRETVVDALLALVQHESIECDGIDADLVIEALLLCRPSNRVSFGDALIWARARSRPDGEVVTFDRRFPADGIALRHPA